jgi:hypothetical protein
VLIASLAVALLGVFVVPVLGAGLEFARYALGWSLLLLAGYPIALAGRYDILFGRIPKKTIERRQEQGGYPWLTEQEKGVLRLLAAPSTSSASRSGSSADAQRRRSEESRPRSRRGRQQGDTVARSRVTSVGENAL